MNTRQKAQKHKRGNARAQRARTHERALVRVSWSLVVVVAIANAEAVVTRRQRYRRRRHHAEELAARIRIVTHKNDPNSLHAFEISQLGPPWLYNDVRNMIWFYNDLDNIAGGQPWLYNIFIISL